MAELDRVGNLLHTHRRKALLDRREGLTTLYNRFHDETKTSADIQKLRQLHVDMDIAAAAAFAETDLDLGHGSHPTKQGVRYTISEPARRDVLQRLLKLNHERYAEEVNQGLHSKKGPAKKIAPKKKAASTTFKEDTSLFNMEDE